MVNPYNQNLDPNPANYQPLTPLSFLERASDVFPDFVAIIHGSQKFTYKEFYTRSKQLASILSQRGMTRGSTVSTLLMNTPPMLEAHYGIPMCGAVIHAINTRLDPATIAFQLDHADSQILLFDLLSLTNKNSESLSGSINDPDTAQNNLLYSMKSLYVFSLSMIYLKNLGPAAFLFLSGNILDQSVINSLW